MCNFLSNDVWVLHLLNPVSDVLCALKVKLQASVVAYAILE